MSLGIIFAMAALLSWGFGDFFIQRSTRHVGVFTTLFSIGAMAFVVFLPFVEDEFIDTWLHHPEKLILLVAGGVVVFIASLLNMEGLKLGKMAVVEPLLAAELPITIALTFFFWNESLTANQLVWVVVIFIGILLVATNHWGQLHYHKRFLEKGVIFAIFGTIGMAFTNFLTGAASQTTSPLFAIWFIHSLLALLCLIYFLVTNQIKMVLHDIKKNPQVVLIESFFDNAAWTSFAFAARYIPIAIANAMGEGYIALAVVLGILVNKEKLKRHQAIGVVLSVIGVIILSFFTK